MHEDSKSRREILAGKVRFISLCRRGKTGLRALYKSGDKDTLETEVLLKSGDDFEEQGLLYACLYAPNSPDSEGHWASAETIQQMAHDGLRGGLKLDIYHDEEEITSDRAGLVESTIIQKGDTRFGDPSKLAGGWGVAIKLIDEDLKKQYREEDWDGTSIGGLAITQEAEPVLVEKAATDSGLVGRIRSWLSRGRDSSITISSPKGTYQLKIPTK